MRQRSGKLADIQEIPLSLYIHLPWCVKKCPYCDFNSHALRQGVPEDAYIEALIRDLELSLADAANRPLSSVFIGGGTPSLFSPEAIARLLSSIFDSIAFENDIEITLEANPGAADEQRFHGYHQAGVNRLSIGIQSFNDRLLKAIGRIHNTKQAGNAYRAARAAGFKNINLDLMYALPGQTLDQALDDLQQAISMGPEHISWYQLTLEPGTHFYKQPPKLPDDDLSWEMQEQGQAMLADAGYVQYEISAYAREARQCRHNLNYWQYGDYLGIGAGAHSKMTTSAGNITRTARIRNPGVYMARAGQCTAIETLDRMSTDALPLDFLINALRLTAGFNTGLFSQRTGLTLQALEPHLASNLDRGLLEYQGNYLRATRQGRQYLNSVLECWLPETRTAA